LRRARSAAEHIPDHAGAQYRSEKYFPITGDGSCVVGIHGWSAVVDMIAVHTAGVHADLRVRLIMIPIIIDPLTRTRGAHEPRRDAQPRASCLTA